MSASVTGGQAAKAHSWLLKADADVGTLQRTALESVWHRRPAVCQLFFSHTETLASGYWLGRGVNNHNAKSTELLSRVLTSFERCQLPLLLNQAGLRGGRGAWREGWEGHVCCTGMHRNWACDALRVERGNIQAHLEIVSWFIHEQFFKCMCIIRSFISFKSKNQIIFLLPAGAEGM